MQLPEIGSVVAVQYERNPTKYSDAALTPRLYLGRVLRHEGRWGFTAALGNYDNVPQECWIEYEEELQSWTDRSFQQPVRSVRFPVSGALLKFFEELEALPEELPVAEDEIRPFAEMRLRFLGCAHENGWLTAPEQGFVYYSDDLPQAEATASRWHRQDAGAYEVTGEKARFEWPVEGKDPAECIVELTRQESGSYYVKNEEFGDEFEADLEEHDGCQVLMGLWAGEGFLSFFGVILPKR